MLSYAKTSYPKNPDQGNSNSSHQLFQKSFVIREMVLNTLFKTGGGHYGGTLSVIDILLVLYKKILNPTPNKEKPNNEKLDKENILFKDQLILSKGHSALGLYCILADLGFFDTKQLLQYGQFQGKLEGHPDMLITPGIDFSSGSLGQGLSVGLGMAFAKRNHADVWVILGDGECQEGQIWEAALLASRYGVDNLYVVIDANGAQECGYKYNPKLPQEPIPNLAEKWASFGWHVDIANGHDFNALEAAFNSAKKIIGKPTVIIAETRKGFGIPMFEKNPEYFHCVALTQDEHNNAMQELRQSYSN